MNPDLSLYPHPSLFLRQAPSATTASATKLIRRDMSSQNSTSGKHTSRMTGRMMSSRTNDSSARQMESGMMSDRMATERFSARQTDRTSEMFSSVAGSAISRGAESPTSERVTTQGSALVDKYTKEYEGIKASVGAEPTALQIDREVVRLVKITNQSILH